MTEIEGSVLNIKGKSSMTHKSKDKIDYLHKMLDNEIHTVNTLFEKDNAFEQIEAKLKELEVKLNSIKDESTVNYKSNTKEQSDYFSKNSLSKSKGKNSAVFEGSFESLSKYKKNKKEKEKEKMLASNAEIRKSKNEQFSSGVKLNFELDEIDEEGTARETKKGKSSLGISNFESNRKSLNKNKCEGTIGWSSNKKRSKSSHTKLQLVEQKTTYPSRNLTRQNSSKKHNTSKGRISFASSDKKIMNTRKSRSNTSIKKLDKSKTSLNLNSYKNTVTLHNNKVKPTEEFHNIQTKERVQEIILKSEAKKLEKELINYKNKTENLQSKVNELKGYKVEYEKLKNVFEKEERARKFRKRT